MSTSNSTIYQQFILDEEGVTKQLEDAEKAETIEINHMKIFDDARKGLLERNYTVLEAMGSLNGVPLSVLIGREIKQASDLRHKEDFYKLTEGIPFRSGNAYTQVPSE